MGSLRVHSEQRRRLNQLRCWNIHTWRATDVRLHWGAPNAPLPFQFKSRHSAFGTKRIRLHLMHLNSQHGAVSANINWIPLRWNETESRIIPPSPCSETGSQPTGPGSSLGQCKTPGKPTGWTLGLWHQLLPSIDPLLWPCIAEQRRRSSRKLPTTQKDARFYCRWLYVCVTNPIMRFI